MCSLKTEHLVIETMEIKGSENIDKEWKSFKIEPFNPSNVEDEQLEKMEDLQQQAKNTSQ